tara:strand:- start:22 stop:363 length:342 start_codon:yes stop_codon:yes gene_type:complete
MIIKSYNFDTKTSVGDCSPTYSRSWELDETDNVFTLSVSGQEPEVLESKSREVYYYILKGKKKALKVLESRNFKQWVYSQWQSGDVWGYAPYLSQMERDILVFGNAQWSQLSE